MKRGGQERDKRERRTAELEDMGGGHVVVALAAATFRSVVVSVCPSFWPRFVPQHL